GEADVNLRLAAILPLPDQLGQAVQRLRPEYHINIGRAPDNGLTLLAGHTAADTNDQVRALVFKLAHTSKIRKYFFLGLFTYRTRIEQNDVVVFGGLGYFDAYVFVLDVDHFVRVVFVHLTAEGANEQLAPRGVGGAGCGRSLGAGHGGLTFRGGGRGGLTGPFQNGFLH